MSIKVLLHLYNSMILSIFNFLWPQIWRNFTHDLNTLIHVHILLKNKQHVASAALQNYVSQQIIKRSAVKGGSEDVDAAININGGRAEVVATSHVVKTVCVCCDDQNDNVAAIWHSSSKKDLHPNTQLWRKWNTLAVSSSVSTSSLIHSAALTPH